MISKNKLKAFTIMEVTIAMLISAIVIGITYTAYSIVNKSWHSFHEKNTRILTLLQLDKLLQSDFLKASAIYRQTDKVIFQTDSDVISYSFQPDFVLRTKSMTDTFKVKTDTLNTLFEHAPVYGTEPGKQNTLDELQLILSSGNEEIPYHYYKVYSAANLFQQTTDAVN